MEFYNDASFDHYKPSIFELIAQEQLRDLLQPALKYVLAFFAQRNPRYLLRIVNKHEEFYACIMFFVEHHNLRKYGASFAENFYGLARRHKPLFETPRADAALGRPADEQALSRKAVRQSLVFLVGLPYLRAKAHDYYESVGGGVDPELLDDFQRERYLAAPQARRERFRRLFRGLYPWCNTAFELWLLAYNVAYLFDKSSFYRPWLAWMGLDIRRARAVIQAAKPSLDPPASLKERLARLLKASPRLVLDSLRVLLPLSIFFIKFLEWWYSPSSPARALSTPPKGPPIPPPRMLIPHPKGKQVDPTNFGECPICRGPVQNATAAPSGYVFCYRCIYTHVEKSAKCPVTLLPVQISQLRKVMA